MKVATNYQLLLDKAIQAVKSREPVSFIGTYGTGVNYLFSLISAQVEKVSAKQTNVCIDLTEVDNEKEIIQRILLSLSLYIKLAKTELDFGSLTSILSSLAKKQPVVLIFNVGIDTKLTDQFYSFLYQLRNLFGWQFSYLFFANNWFIQNLNLSDQLRKKIAERNIEYILPLNPKDANTVLSNYEERYKKVLPANTKKHIIETSSGNAGLLKALYLQAIKTKIWNKVDFTDEGLVYRLDYTLNDWSKDQSLPTILKEYQKLVQKNNKIAKPVNKEDVINRTLTFTERRLYEYLVKNKNNIITRDQIAFVIWGEKWGDKYSDWAIDQYIFQLRTKLLSDKNYGRIHTKKGEGFIFSIDLPMR